MSQAHRGGKSRGSAERAQRRVASLLVDDPGVPFEDRARIATREVAAEVMAEDLRPADLVTLAAEAAALAESLAAEAHRMSPPRRPIACRAGCGHCCHISVAAAPAEVLRLAEHIRNRFPSAARQALIERLRRAAALTTAERLAQRLPCPMLKDERCSVHEARPLNCRGLESMDAEICRRASQGEPVEVPVYAAHWLVHNRILAGLVAGTGDAGRGAEQLDLFPALLAALETPDAARRWLAGEAVFAHCRWPVPESTAPSSESAGNR